MRNSFPNAIRLLYQVNASRGQRRELIFRNGRVFKDSAQRRYNQMFFIVFILVVSTVNIMFILLSRDSIKIAYFIVVSLKISSSVDSEESVDSY